MSENGGESRRGNGTEGPGTSSPEVAEVLSLLAKERGLELRLVRRFERGDEGAYEVVTPAGHALVLKWIPWSEAAATAATATARRLERLRGHGSPIPAQVASGRAGDVLFELQELAAGQPVQEVTESVLEQLLAAVAAQRGAGLGTPEDWWEFLIDGLFRDRAPLCRPSVLHGCTGPVEQLLRRLRKAALDAGPPRRVPNDVVHFDFGPANVLADRGRLTAILDWQSCRDGDAGYDLVTTDWDLAAWPKAAPGIRERLAQEIARTCDKGAVAGYAAHTVLRNLTWSYGTEWEEHIVRTGHAFLDRWATG
ncbi:aminoglycoside phosphotransferase family protein [Streptomyces hygroscopicus]|uniref:aminoglycoside phosphotransferase family protein n=1 Tax=Streptomyces hygroscopicus TaxID=1912 RepID=UPI0036A8046A